MERCKCLLALLALWFCKMKGSIAFPIDNGVKGYPHVTCGVHSIRVDVDTEKPFQGRVFVKGESYNKDCIRSFVGSPAAPSAGPIQAGSYGRPPAPLASYSETIGIELGFGQCNMRRQRTLYPRGVEYTFTLVVSFHSLFITKVDKAYRIRCFYMEAEKTVAQQLEVSMLSTHQVNEQFPMPQCRYHIRRGARDGPPVRYARVGEPVYHVWECDAPAAYLYGILVKSCFVDDGQGNKVELIDERGCANDRHIIPDLTYDASLITAFTESHVFKYADKPSLYFACTVVLCFKQDGGCNGITPPACSAPITPVAPAPYPQPPVPVEVPLPVPAPYPVPVPAPVPYSNGAPSSVPIVPVAPYRPPVAALPPYNRDEPILRDDSRNNATQKIDDKTITDSFSHQSVNLTTRRAVRSSTDRRHKRENTPMVVNNHLRKNAIRVETDLSAQPVVVLPFDENPSMQEEDLEELLKTTPTGGVPLKHAFWVPVTSGSNMRGVCMSSSGFGILVALFLALLILSASMTALMVRRYMGENRSKI